MKKILTLAIILVGMLFLNGCGETDTTVGPSSTPFVGGTTALSMEFVEGAPPIEIFDDSQFPFAINIKIENLGEDNVDQGDGYVEITGIDATEFGLSQDDLKQDIPFDIKGVVKNFQGIVLIGDTVIVEFNNLNFEQNIRGNWDGPRIRTNLCYNYETEATAALCLKRDMLTNIDTKEICELTGEKQVFNSGAPIQITRVYQTPLGSDKVQVQFEISHVGDANDRFYKENTNCDDRSTNTDKDKVYFEIETEISGTSAKCSGLQNTNSAGSGGEVILYNGKPRTIVCSFDVSDVQGVYEKQIIAKLNYRYSQFIEKRILIKDVSTGSNE